MKDLKFAEEVSKVLNILGNGKVIILDSSNIDENYAIIPFFTTVMIPSKWLTKISGYDGVTAALNESTQTNKPQPLGAFHNGI